MRPESEPTWRHLAPHEELAQLRAYHSALHARVQHLLVYVAETWEHHIDDGEKLGCLAEDATERTAFKNQHFAEWIHRQADDLDALHRQVHQLRLLLHTLEGEPPP